MSVTPVPQCTVKGAHGPHDIGIDNDTLLPCPGRSTKGGHKPGFAAAMHQILLPGRECPECDYVAPPPTTLNAEQQIRAHAVTAAATLYSTATGTIRTADVVRVAVEFEAYITGGVKK